MPGGRAGSNSWWQKIKQHPLETVVIIGASIVGVALIVVIFLGYRFNWAWTGLDSNILPSKASSFQREKTLWDWLQLLLIPLVLAVGGYLFNLNVNRNEQRAAANRDQNEREIAQETIIQEYINKMAELLLHEKLRGSAEDDEVRKIARVLTLTVLPRLNANRKRSLLQFLYEAGLLKKGEGVLDLRDADLSRAYLSGAYLKGAYLKGAYLKGAKLLGAYLSRADLSYANLSEAYLVDAYLAGANLKGANLRGANLKGVSLSGANLSRANLKGANLSGADLSYANLSEAYLVGAFLSEANLKGAFLVEAELKGANLKRAFLSGADLSEAYLLNANLAYTDLSGADLRRTYLGLANLKRAKVTPEQLKQASSLKGSITPEGKKHP
jgi:uncharacterized protein YjbI with pentapeptide repeats